MVILFIRTYHLECSVAFIHQFYKVKKTKKRKVLTLFSTLAAASAEKSSSRRFGVKQPLLLATVVQWSNRV